MSDLADRLRVALGDRRDAYRRTFTGPVAELVMRDLAYFCRANESTFHDNERVQSKLDGRREVWLRIAEHLNLSPEQLWALYNRQPGD